MRKEPTFIRELGMAIAIRFDSIAATLAGELLREARRMGFHTAKHRRHSRVADVEFELAARLEPLLATLNVRKTPSASSEQYALPLTGVQFRPLFAPRQRKPEKPRERNSALKLSEVDLLTIAWAEVILSRGYRGNMRFSETLVEIRRHATWCLGELGYVLHPEWAFTCPMNSLWVTYPEWERLARADGATTEEINIAREAALRPKKSLPCGQRSCDVQCQFAIPDQVA